MLNSHNEGPKEGKREGRGAPEVSHPHLGWSTKENSLLSLSPSAAWRTITCLNKILGVGWMPRGQADGQGSALSSVMAAEE